MYTVKMQNLMNELQLNMSGFNNTLVQVQQGVISLDSAQSKIENYYIKVKRISNTINSTSHPSTFNQVHRTLKEAANLYVEGLNEFLKLYDDGNDDHMVSAGLMINEGTNKMYETADMLNRL